MGVCASSPAVNQNNTKSPGDDVIAKGRAMVVHANGDEIQEFKLPVRAVDITSRNPGCFLCHWESMFIGSCVPRLPDEELLQPGQIYFLMPDSRAHVPLSLTDLCVLAIKASTSAFRK